MFNNKLYVRGDQNVQVPAHLNFGTFMLERLRRLEDEVALENAETGETLTYKRLIQYAVDLSVSLIGLGIGKGDVVALGSEKRNMFIPTALAIIFTGATYTPFDLYSGKAILKHKWSITKPIHLICSNMFWETYCEVFKSLKPVETLITLDDTPVSAISVESLTAEHFDVETFEPANVHGQIDTSCILYSSGTTGMPKGVQLTHLNCILNSLSNEFKDERLTTGFICGEWFHNYDFFTTFKFLAAGRKLVYNNEFTREKTLNCLEKCKVSIAFMVPSMVSWISKIEMEEKYNFDSLKVIYSRSCPLHIRTIEKVKQRFPAIENILQGYGMTEAGEPASENWGSKGPKPGSVGKASPGTIFKVVNPETREMLGPNQHGEICLKGSNLMKGYIGVESSSYLDEQGFFKTGDLGYYDEDEYLYIIDRLKEIVIYDGYKIAPLELETILLLHPGVREAGVVGKPVPEYGEEPTAFVVRQPGTTVTGQELVDYVASEVSPYMQLRGGIIFISEIPRNPRGKILRRRLKEMLEKTL